ncbi:type IV secretory system conjugative DNA transfer family protein [Streptomyces sp. NPDC001255]|uniref:type IV secretory system conjugative DNA transfer family protein n=1 Tax=Streptomyces sp. NPDC001255 TaxID=3364550 RepID=UPI003684CD19
MSELPSVWDLLGRLGLAGGVVVGVVGAVVLALVLLPAEDFNRGFETGVRAVVRYLSGRELGSGTATGDATWWRPATSEAPAPPPRVRPLRAAATAVKRCAVRARATGVRYGRRVRGRVRERFPDVLRAVGRGVRSAAGAGRAARSLAQWPALGRAVARTLARSGPAAWAVTAAAGAACGRGAGRAGRWAVRAGRAAYAAVVRSGRAAGRVVGGAAVGVVRVLRAWGRWPYAVRAAVRIAPGVLAWGVLAAPGATRAVVLVLLGVVVLAALSGPSGARWWFVPPRRGSGPRVHAEGLWVALRQVLKLPDDEPVRRWLHVPEDADAPGACIRLRVPVEWIGGKDGPAAVERIVAERAPGAWVAEWDRTGATHWAEWRRPAPPRQRPVLPAVVPWRDTGHPRRLFLGQAIDGYDIVDALIETDSHTPHWGVAGDSGSGKSTVLYIPVVHCRLNGELIDIIDTKRNSLRAAEGFSGVRVHKTIREGVGAFAEFITSMMAAEAAMDKFGDAALKAQLHPRTLVIDELPTFIRLAYTWWRYGLGGKGAPPFLSWLGIILLQGRSSDHRVVIGTHQFANEFFGGTMERAQIGTRVLVGQQERTSWGVAFGPSTPQLGYSATIPGRGAFSDKSRTDGGDLYVREIQPCYITPHVEEYLTKAPAAPEWFDAGRIAPWITPELLAEVSATAATEKFMPGEKYGPPHLPTARAGAVPAGASQAAANCYAPSPDPHNSSSVMRPDLRKQPSTPAPDEGVTDVTEEAELPRTYSLTEAYEAGIIRYKAKTIRVQFSRGEERGISRPEGITDGNTRFYTAEELRNWEREYQATGGRRKNKS